MPAIRLPAGWPSDSAAVAAPPAPPPPPPIPATPPPSRWTITTPSVTVPARIIAPITATSHLSARNDIIPPPQSPPTQGEETIALTAPAEAAGERADRFLARAIGAVSRSRVKALIESGQASRDGAPLTDPAAPVRAGARYVLRLPPPEPATPVAQAMPLAILFEDAHLIVLDKPAGLVVHPAPGNPDGTLVNALLAHAGDALPGIGGEKRPGIVHRLDKDTSGVMVVAKTDRAHQALSGAFAARRDLERAYLALVWGLPAPPAGEIEAPIGRHPADRKRMAVVAPGRGKAALTRYVTERTFGTACALLRCRLATGRTHQIRVHLAHMGHPVVGDPIYCRRVPAGLSRALPEPLRSALLAFPRQALHAATLGFRHPVSGAALRFESPLPADIAGLIAQLAAAAAAPGGGLAVG